MIFPLVSIIIPTYNRANLIGATLDSVLAQTYPNWECIIVDDGSTDETRDVLNYYSIKDCRFKIVYRPLSVKKGASVCRNIGIKLSKGLFIQFLDSDDILSDNKIAEQVPVLLSEDELYIATCKWGIFNGRIKESEIYNENYLYKNFNNTRSYFDLLGKYGGYLPLHCFLIPKKVIEKAGYWNESLTLCDDGEFIFRIIINCSQIKFCGKTFVLYRKTVEGSLSNLNSEVKALSLVNSWKIIEVLYDTRYNENDSLYLANKKQNIYNDLKNSYIDIIYSNKNFFIKQIRNDTLILKIKKSMKKIMSKLSDI